MSMPLAIIGLIVAVAFAFALVKVRGHFTREIKRLHEVNVVLQGQVTALGTLMTHVINALDDAPREVVSNTFKTFLGKRLSVNPPPLSEEDKNTFNQAFSMTVLAIIEEIKSKQSE
jgi:hypothetical protein